MNPKKPRCAVYARVSTADQNVEMQIVELTQFAALRGWDVEVFEDRGFSGKNTSRPALKRLMEAASKRQIDIVLVWKLDRFARSLADLVNMVQRLTDLNVAFVSFKDGIDLTTEHGKLLLGILGSLSEFERNLIISRVKAGLEHAKRKGKKLGRRQIRDDNMIRRLRAEGHTHAAIASRLGISEASVRNGLKTATNPLKSASKTLRNSDSQAV